MQAALSPVQVDPQVPIEDFDSRYAEIAAANFSVVQGCARTVWRPDHLGPPVQAW